MLLFEGGVLSFIVFDSLLFLGVEVGEGLNSFCIGLLVRF
jgi:hypothetical protein